MEISIIGLFTLFGLLACSSLLYIIAQKIKLPYTVLLVLFGSLLVPFAFTESGKFLAEFHLTPEILFYVFLPVLVFESAYNMKIQSIVENIRSISLLAIVGLVVSAFSIAGLLFYILPLIGITIPFIVLLLFGVLISATDPVAVLALFKEFGAPKRLSLIFEGESLFNDATAVALFFVVLDIATSGFHGAASLLEGTVMFTSMIVLGTLFGFGMGLVTSKLIQYVRSSDFASITLGLVSAHITFIAAEFISHHMHVGAYHFAISPIIATTVAAMVLGNYGRSKISPLAEEFVDKFWGQLAFISNSLVFVLVGLLSITLPIAFPQFIVPILITVLVVALSRAISIYPVIGLLNMTKTEKYIPMSWQHLLSWGSLRGALAVTMVLLIPADFAPAGWVYDFSVREFVLALTVGCIYATLFVKATSMGYVIRKMKIDELSEFGKVQFAFAEGLVASRTLRRLEAFKERGYVGKGSYEEYKAKYTQMLNEAVAVLRPHKELTERAMKQFFVGEERDALKYIFAYNELSESVYKRILRKLNLQHEALENGEVLPEHEQEDKRDVFEWIVSRLRKFIVRQTKDDLSRDQYSYYKTQKIIAEKVLKETSQFADGYYEKLELAEDIKKECARYESYVRDLEKKIAEFPATDSHIVSEQDKYIRGSLLKKQKRLLESLSANKVLDPGVAILLEERIDEVLHR
jgi:CPA1 family monovalent cation:H+ antiporter